MPGNLVPRPSETEKELYFLISKFLEKGPCQNAFKALQNELRTCQLLPKTIDVEGNECDQSTSELSKKNPHITNDTLLLFCERLRDNERSGDPLGMLPVRSLLGPGRYNLLRTTKALGPLPLNRIAARLHGCPLQNPAGSSEKKNFVRALEARRTSGAVSRSHLLWPKLYNRVQLLNQTVGHISGVYCVLFDQTGQFIFTGADDLLVKVWSTVSGRLLATFRGASSEITDLAVNVENTMLAAGSLDRVCYVWCLQTTALIAQLSANVGMITGVNFCPMTCGGCRYLACTSTDGSVAFWVYTHQPIGIDTVFLQQPILFNEKMRPGVAQMICSAFSPGGAFLAAGSADHHVRVYQIPGMEGPQRIMEEEAHSDRVDSIQWANKGLRFISGSKDGAALLWHFSRQKWSYLKLDITQTLPGDTNNEVAEEQARQKPRVSMVCWDKSDKWIVTAGHDASLKVWNADTGQLLHVLRNHRRDVFVLEPHPMDEGILLSAGHDGLLCIWDIRPGACLLQHQNIIDGRGHAAFYDAKWSPDGTLIAATDSNGHILLFGFGAANQCLKEIPKQLFFNTDYWPLVRDGERGLLDETTGEPPHLMAAPFLVDVDGTPYPPHLQRLVPGREFQDSLTVELPAAANQGGTGIRENGIAGAYFPSAELASSRGNTPNAWTYRMLLPLLPSLLLRQIREVMEAKAKAERTEYEKERRRRAVSPSHPRPDTAVKPKTRKKRAGNYKTRATAADEPEFLNPDTLDLSSHEESASSSDLEDSSFSDTSSTDYSDWIADHGVSLEPPTRSRRRRPPVKLSPSPTTRKKRVKKAEPEVPAKPESSDGESGDEDPLKPEKIKEVPAEYVPPKWLSEVQPRKAPYYPQMGDHIMFFQEGYKLYLEAVRKKQVYKTSTRDSFSKLSLDDPIFVQVIGIKYEIRPPRLCCLKLAVMDENGTMTNQFFNIKYHDVPDVIDFMVLKQTFDVAISRDWQPGDRFRCVIDDSWWHGGVVSTRSNRMYEDSPFLSLFTKWDNGEDEPMSPWDLEPVDEDRQPAEAGGSIDLLPEEALALLYCPRADEWPDGDRDGACVRIIAGLELVMTLSIAEPFCAPVDLNLYPAYAISVEYPVDLSTIKSRLENRFYRRLTGVQFDVRYLATNAEKFNDSHSQIVKHARIVSELCIQIIKIIKEKSVDLDVMTAYHQLVEGYQSSSDEEVEVEEGGGESENEGLQLRSAHVTGHDSVNWRGDCARLLRELLAHPDSEAFREPVDLQALPDYLKVVSTPMDLGTVSEELMADNYNSPRDFLEAVRLIFDNSRKYNTNKKSQIYGMSIRLSNLFEARMKKLHNEWKASRRRRIQQATQKRKLRVTRMPRAGPSTRTDSGSDPLKSSDDEQPSASGKNAVAEEPQPSTSRVPPFRIRWSPVGAAADESESDDNTNLSTLRFTFAKQSGSEDDRTNDGKSRAGTSRNNESSTDADDTRTLSTLKRSGAADDLQENGHSYAKKVVTKVLVVQSASDMSHTEDDDVDGQRNPPAALNGVEDSSSAAESEESLWDGQPNEPAAEEEEEEENEFAPSESDSNTSGSNYSNNQRPGRRKTRQMAARMKSERRKSRQHSDDSEDEESDDSRLQETTEMSSSESESSEPVRTRRRRKPARAREEDSPPRRAQRSRPDSDDSPPRRRKRRKKNSSASDSSNWHPSDSDDAWCKRRRSRRRLDSDEEAASNEDQPSVSSRGRLRKITEKAAALRKRRR